MPRNLRNPGPSECTCHSGSTVWPGSGARQSRRRSTEVPPSARGPPSLLTSEPAELAAAPGWGVPAVAGKRRHFSDVPSAGIESRGGAELTGWGAPSSRATGGKGTGRQPLVAMAVTSPVQHSEVSDLLRLFRSLCTARFLLPSPTQVLSDRNGPPAPSCSHASLCPVFAPAPSLLASGWG